MELMDGWKRKYHLEYELLGYVGLMMDVCFDIIKIFRLFFQKKIQ